MFLLFGRSCPQTTIGTLYGTIVAQARLPCFYLDYGVPDTVNGRFDLIVLHLALVLRRLARQKRRLPEAGQALFDWFCRDMDDNLREIGIADLKVPKEMRKIGEAYYGRAQAYEAAIVAGSEAVLAKAIIRNIYNRETVDGPACRLARYTGDTVSSLDMQTDAALLAGRVTFPDPATIQAASFRTGT